MISTIVPVMLTESSYVTTSFHRLVVQLELVILEQLWGKALQYKTIVVTSLNLMSMSLLILLEQPSFAPMTMDQLKSRKLADPH